MPITLTTATAAEDEMMADFAVHTVRVPVRNVVVSRRAREILRDESPDLADPHRWRADRCIESGPQLG
jgi:hypothetical protein